VRLGLAHLVSFIEAEMLVFLVVLVHVIQVYSYLLFFFLDSLGSRVFLFMVLKFSLDQVFEVFWELIIVLVAFLVEGEGEGLGRLGVLGFVEGSVRLLCFYFFHFSLVLLR